MVQPYNTTVSSVIVYQCQLSGFAPSVPTSVCGEDGRWSPDPSQVLCVTVPGNLQINRLFLQSATLMKPTFYTKTIYCSVTKECPWVEYTYKSAKDGDGHSFKYFCTQLSVKYNAKFLPQVCEVLKIVLLKLCEGASLVKLTP